MSVFIRLPCRICCSQCLLQNLTYGYTQYITLHTHKHTYRILTFSPSVAWYVHAVFRMLELPPFPHSSCMWSYLTKWQKMWHNKCFRLMAGGIGDTDTSDKSQRTHAQMRSHLQEQIETFFCRSFSTEMSCAVTPKENESESGSLSPCAHTCTHERQPSSKDGRLRRKTHAHRSHMTLMQQHTKTLKGTDDRYINKL
jgi:hypothetical protein